jgi:hypothetical protein
MSSYAIQDEDKWEIPALGVVSSWFGVIIIGVTAVSQIINYPGQSSPAEGLKVILIALLLASLLYVLIVGNRNVKLAAVPLIINLWTLIIIQFVPFETMWERLRFRWNLPNYQQIIYLVETGQLQPDAQGEVMLPAPYQYLSAHNGRILTRTHEGTIELIFFTRYNTPQDFSGYFYRADDTPPTMNEFGGRWRHVAQVRPNWFFCESS